MYSNLTHITFIVTRATFTREINLRTGSALLDIYRLDWKLHRDPDEGPAYLMYRDDGSLYEERFYWRGKLHRIDGPAKITYAADSYPPEEEIYYRHGLVHRDPKEGPAWVERDNHIILHERYWVAGRPFRDPSDGPDYICRSQNGIIIDQQYSEPREISPRRPSRKSGKPEPHI